MNSGTIRPATLARVVGDLRAGEPERESDGLHRMYDWRGGPIGGRRTGARLHAGGLPGDAVPRLGDANRRPQPARRGSTRICSAPRSISSRLNQKHLESHPGTRDLEARIASYGWPSRCRPRARAVDIARSRRRPRSSTGSARRRPIISAASASSRGGWSRRGVRSSSSTAGRAPARVVDAHYGAGREPPAPLRRDRQPMAGLSRRPQARGLLDSTLVRLGRRVRAPCRSRSRRSGAPQPARLHHVARGRRRQGRAGHRRDHEFGYRAVEEPCSVHDLHATILHALGLDHRKLTYYYGGRESG